jgi:hypothetical protein
MMHWLFKIIFIGLFTVSTAAAGSLDAPEPPDSSGSAMHTLEHIYTILTTGDPDQITMRHAFEEPQNGPDEPSYFHDLDEIFNVAPKYTENFATVDDVVPGKFFWGLGKNSKWGKLSGSPNSSRIESPVLKTGQTTQVEKYSEWNSKNYQDDAFWAAQGYGIDCSNEKGARFEVQKKPDNQIDNGIVTDKKTGLMWVQNPYCWSSNNCYEASMNWDDAFTKIKALDNLPLGCTDSSEVACYTDWRLPNIKELQSLIDYGHTSPAMPENYKDAFTENSIKNYYYWSSTTNLNNPYAHAWAIYMVTGAVNGQSKSNPCYVWPVRGGKK